jgi:acetolactate synthase I/II/III large subunit
MKNYQDGGEAILEAFRNLGIDYVISSPGSEWGSVWEALARQKIENKPGPTYIDCWHETIAVDMALGYTQMTGRPQAVLLHAGPGLMQGSVGIHAALQTEIPMIIMSGESLTLGENPNFDPGLQWYRSLSVVGGPHRLVEPIVKWATQVTSPYTLYESVVRAVEMAQRPPAGPVYLNVPIENMLHDWLAPAKLRKVPPAPKTQPQSGDIDKVASLLLAARAPLIITDSAGRDSATFAALVGLAELLGIPVVEGNYCAYANFPRDHPLYLGTDSGPYLDAADLVLLVRSRIPWYPPSRYPRNASIVAISETPLKTYMVYQNLHSDIYLEGDVATSLSLLADALRVKGVTPVQFQERRQHWSREHEKLVARLSSAEAKANNAEPVDPLALCAALRVTMPPNTIFVDETITHRSLIGRNLWWNEPQSYFYVSGGLGQGLGVALGVKLAAPERPVVLLIGDGSFLYNPVLQGLGASKDFALPILIIVFNNRKYSSMQQNHTAYYPDGVAVGTGTFYGVHINGPDYAELGRPFGLSGHRVRKTSDLKETLLKATRELQAGNTVIVSVDLTR